MNPFNQPHEPSLIRMESVPLIAHKTPKPVEPGVSDKSQPPSLPPRLTQSTPCLTHRPSQCDRLKSSRTLPELDSVHLRLTFEAARRLRLKGSPLLHRVAQPRPASPPSTPLRPGSPRDEL
ncbi:hypothetical protein BDQ12DRAFT_472548 [Crucibulum laeve]|uniref:Uncharacterized protein n=1 Tax=Crucibulum laeve TaxID=68775 RepID=A0A5C3LJL2_9AGAR|nr:hypothetical protein BDQ12DRAFT_472548 [Crucibulum laeve]